MSAAKPPEHPAATGEQQGGHEKGGKSLLSYPVDAVKALGKGVWGTLGFFGRRARAVMSDTWGATVGNLGETVSDVAESAGLPVSKEKRGLVEAISATMGWTRDQIKGLGVRLGTIAGTVVGAPLAIGQRGFVSLANLPAAAITGKSKKEKGSAAHGGAEENGRGANGKTEHH